MCVVGWYMYRLLAAQKPESVSEDSLAGKPFCRSLDQLTKPGSIMKHLCRVLRSRNLKADLKHLVVAEQHVQYVGNQKRCLREEKAGLP